MSNPPPSFDELPAEPSMKSLYKFILIKPDHEDLDERQMEILGLGDDLRSRFRALIMEVKKGEFYLGGECKVHVDETRITSGLLSTTREEIDGKIPVSGHDVYALERGKQQLCDFEIVLKSYIDYRQHLQFRPGSDAFMGTMEAFERRQSDEELPNNPNERGLFGPESVEEVEEDNGTPIGGGSSLLSGYRSQYN